MYNAHTALRGHIQSDERGTVCDLLVSSANASGTGRTR
jgi:hypothetical protein